MAESVFHVDIQLNKNTLIGAKIYPLPTSSRTALSLVSDDEGLLVFDTTLNTLYAWNGTAWQAAVPTVTGGLILKGGIAANATEPATPAAGDLYVFTSAGTTSWTPAATVEVGDQAYWDGTAWQYIQTNIGQATTGTVGYVQLATQSEVNTGSSSSLVVTPATLAGYVPANSLTLRPVRRYSTIITSLVANTPSTVTHGLALNAAAEVGVSCYQGGSQIFLAVSPVDANSITVTSNLTLSNITVVCLG